MKTERFKLVCACAVAVGLAACNNLQIPSAAVTGDDDWITSGRSYLRPNAATTSLVPPLSEMWIYNAGGGFGPTSPLWVGDILVVGTRKGEVHGIEAGTGKKIGIKGFGGALEGGPALSRGKLVLPVGWGTNKGVKVYDLVRGRTHWVQRTGPVETGVVSSESMVVTVTDEPRIVGFKLDTGELAWATSLAASSSVKAYPLSAGEQVFVADTDGFVRSIDMMTGYENWVIDVEAPVYQTPAIEGEYLYVGTTRGTVHALTLSGEKLWSRSVAGTAVRITSPAVLDGSIVVGTAEGHVVALTTTGQELWRLELADAVVAPPLLTTGGHAFVGTMGRELIAIDMQTVEPVWTVELKGRIKSPMAARGDQLVVLTEPRHVYLFTTETDENVAHN